MATRECLDVLEAIHSTPARRYLKPDPIPDDVLWELLDAAIRAPTGGNSQGWAWYVVRDAELKAEIGRRYREVLVGMYGAERWPEEQLAEGRIVTFRSDLHTGGAISLDAGFGIDSRNRAAVIHLAEHIHEAPVLIIPVLRGATLFGDTWGGGASAGSFIYGAVQNLMLAARSYGIAAPLTATAGLLERVGINELLGLPEHARGMAIVPLGYPARGRWAQPKRVPVEEVVYWDAWGSTRERRAADLARVKGNRR